MKKSLFLFILFAVSFSQLISRVPADTNWRNVFHNIFHVEPAPNLVFINNTGMYIGGAYFVLYDTVKSLAKWDGTNWKALKDTNGFDGINGIANCLTGENSNIYVGGFFDSAGSVPVNNIAMWDGSNWHSLGSGLNGQVMSIAVKNNVVYATGFFDSAGSVPAHRIAKWDGSVWSAVGSGLYGFKDQQDIDASMGTSIIFGRDNKIYVAGCFDSAGNVAAKNIAVWNDTSWSSLGAGITQRKTSQFNTFFIYSLAADDNYLYVCGDFVKAGGDSIFNLARWNGSNWSSLGISSDQLINSLSVYENDLYVAGNFNTIGSVQSNNVALWRNGNWESLGSGIDAFAGVSAISTYNDILISVGYFYITGDTTYCESFGFWSESPIPQPMFTAIQQSKISALQTLIYPNPALRTVKVRFTSPEDGTDVISIIDGKGIVIKELYSGYQTAGEHEYLWNAADFSAGIYFCTIVHNGKKMIQKIIITK